MITDARPTDNWEAWDAYQKKIDDDYRRVQDMWRAEWDAARAKGGKWEGWKWP